MFWSVREEPPVSNCIRGLFQSSLGGQVNLPAPAGKDEILCSSSFQGRTSWLGNELDSMKSNMSSLMKKNTSRDKTYSQETYLALRIRVDRKLFDAHLANLSTRSNRKQLLEDFPKI